MELDWVGKAVSIECEQRLGVFQGVIKDISAEEITIVRAFRNGVPLRQQDAEVTLKSSDILKITLIPSYNGQSTLNSTVINKPTPVKLPGFNTNNTDTIAASTFNVHNSVHKEKQQQQWFAKDSAMSITKKLSDVKIENGASFIQQFQEKQHPFKSKTNEAISKSSPATPYNNSVAQFFVNMIPPKVEARMGSAFSACTSSNAAANSSFIPKCANALESGENGEIAANSNCITKPIDIIGNRNHGRHQNSSSSNNGSNNGGNGNGNGYGRSRNGNGNGTHSSTNGFTNGANGKSKRQQRNQLRHENHMRQQNRAFATSVDDPLLNEDFDFEGNLALFDKQAIWNVIESGGQKQSESTKSEIKKKYRHDENVLEHEPPQLRSIEALFDGSTDMVTDEGIIIPTVPHIVRSKIEITADRNGLTFQRQIDMLARSATDVAITILGGARRLCSNNYHQWPKVAIICEKSANFKSANIGAVTGRQLASHGIEVVLYLEDHSSIEQKCNEISLFKATGNLIVYSVNDLPASDLVILSTNTANLSSDVKRWLGESRASILAIDPPPSGIKDIAIKCAILPILPLNGISAAKNCGKLYLCNLGIPEKFYRDAGVKYKSPFGHKFVITIHPKH